MKSVDCIVYGTRISLDDYPYEFMTYQWLRWYALPIEDSNFLTITFLKWANPGLFYCLFSVFSNKHLIFYNKYMWKNVHPVYGAGIQAYDLWNVSLFP